MIMGHKWLEEFAVVLWPALADHVLQATLITIICFLALPLFHRAGARARHTLWLVAFVRFTLEAGVQCGVAGNAAFNTCHPTDSCR